MHMRKIISIVFLLLILIISLGVSLYMGSFNGLTEGLENETVVPAEGESAPTEGESAPAEGESAPAEGEESTFDVTPMDSTCTETMSNYN